MRLLVSFILSFLFLVAQGSSPAGKGWEKKSLNGITETAWFQGFLDHSFNEDYCKAVVPSNPQSHSTNHYRFYPHASFAKPVIFSNRINILYNLKYAIDPYLYCKRFGLKLIFPEHYFW